MKSAALLFAFPALAGAVQLKLSDAVRESWRSSPQLRAQRELSTLADSDRWRRFLPKEPQLQYSKTDDGVAESFGLSLTTSFPGRSFALMDLDARKANAQAAELRARQYDLTRMLVLTYVECASARAMLRLQETTAADLETIFHSLRVLYETGHATQAEKIGAELQSRQSKLDLSAAADKQTLACARLSHLLPAADPPETELPDDIEASLLAELGLQTADQARADSSIAVATATLSTVYWSQMPDLTFSLTRNHYHYLPGSPSGKAWSDSVGVAVTLPLLFPFEEAAEARRARSQANLDRSAADLQKLAADEDVQEAAGEYRRSRDRLAQLKGRDLALGEALMESTFSAYRSGKLGYSELVLARKTLTDLRSQEIQLKSSIINAHLRCLDRCDQTPVRTK